MRIILPVKTRDGTQTDRVSIYSEPDYLIVMKITYDGCIEEVYNGKGSSPWENAGKIQKNGQRSISLKNWLL